MRGIRGALVFMVVVACIGAAIFIARSFTHPSREARLPKAASAPPAGATPLPALDAPVVDTTGTISPEDREDLAGELEYLELRRGGPVYVVLVPTVGEEDVDAFADRLGRACNRDRTPEKECTLIVMAKDQRQVALSVGLPLLDVLSDSTQAVVEKALAQSLKAGSPAGGIDVALRAIEAAVAITTPDFPPGSPDAEGQHDEAFTSSLLHDDPLEAPWFWALAVAGAIVGTVLRVFLHPHRFICGTLGLIGGVGVLGIAHLLLHDLVLGAFGAILLATIAMGFGWFWLWFFLNLLFELLIGAITGGGGGGFSGGGGSFGGGGASGSW